MIVIDTSALMAIIKGEPEAAACRAIIEAETELLIAAPTLTEALVVARGRELFGEMAALIADLAMTVVPFSEYHAYAAVRGYERWGKGYNRAALNICDSFAYALAMEIGCPLLFVGNDFVQTDVQRAE